MICIFSEAFALVLDLCFFALRLLGCLQVDGGARQPRVRKTAERLAGSQPAIGSARPGGGRKPRQTGDDPPDPIQVLSEPPQKRTRVNFNHALWWSSASFFLVFLQK